MSESRTRRGTLLLATTETAVASGGLGLLVNLLASAVPSAWVNRHRPWIAVAAILLIPIGAWVAERRARRSDDSPTVDRSARTDARGARGPVVNIQTVQGDVVVNASTDEAITSGHIDHHSQSITNLPHDNPTLIVRHEELSTIGRLDTAKHLVRVIVLYGPIGVGKSQLAWQYAHRSSDRYPLRWHIPANERDEMVMALIKLAERLNISTEGQTSEVAAAVLDTLSRRSGWLLIFDDVDDPADLTGYVPACGDGLILITSRNPNWSTTAYQVPVACPKLNEAVAYLQSRTGDPDRTAAMHLAQLLGRLPLALAQAANVIERTPGMTLKRCADHFEEIHPRLLNEGQPSGYPAPLGAMVRRNIELLTNRAAVDLLRLSAFLAPEPEHIALRLVQAGAGTLPRHLSDAVRDLDHLDRLTAALYNQTLVGWDPDGIQVHSLIQRIVQHELDPRHASEWAARAVDIVLANLPATSTKPRYRREAADILPHALAVLPHAGPEAALRLRIAVGAYLAEDGSTIQDLEDALDHLRTALDLAEQIYGAGHPSVTHIHTTINTLHARLARSSIFRHARLGHVR